jgi:DHA1 family tetracycline resistance protein-like MFS transporter
MFVGLIRILFQLVVFPKLVNVLSRDVLFIVGLLSIFFAYIQIISIVSGVFMFVVMALFSIGAGIIRPTLTSEISSKTDLRNRGKVMGVADSLQSISQVLAPIIGGIIIETIFPGLIGLLSAVILLPSIILSLFIISNRFRKPKSEYIVSNLPD